MAVAATAGISYNVKCPKSLIRFSSSKHNNWKPIITIEFQTEQFLFGFKSPV